MLPSRAETPVTVGTTLAGGPSCGSVLALLVHTALTLDENGKPLFMPGVNDAGGWEPGLCDVPPAVPVETGFLAATAQGAVPQPRAWGAERAHCFPVSWYGVVSLPAPEGRSEPGALLFHGFVPTAIAAVHPVEAIGGSRKAHLLNRIPFCSPGVMVGMGESKAHMGNRQPNSTPSWTDVKVKLADFDRAALLELIPNLYAAHKENQLFLHARLGLEKDVLEPCKETIARWLWPDVLRNQDTSVDRAKQAISDYKKAVLTPRASPS
jgi:hypothetical protein